MRKSCVTSGWNSLTYIYGVKKKLKKYRQIYDLGERKSRIHHSVTVHCFF